MVEAGRRREERDASPDRRPSDLGGPATTTAAAIRRRRRRRSPNLSSMHKHTAIISQLNYRPQAIVVDSSPPSPTAATMMPTTTTLLSGATAAAIAVATSTSLASSSSLPGDVKAAEPCAVCGDKATGFHYNALTCEGCKGFFRRSVSRTSRYVCKTNQNCEIDVDARRKCQFCRMKKCIRAGMRIELPEAQCRQKREAKQRRHQFNVDVAYQVAVPALASPPDVLSPIASLPMPTMFVTTMTSTSSSSMLPSSSSVVASTRTMATAATSTSLTRSAMPTTSSCGHNELPEETSELISRLAAALERFECPTDETLEALSTSHYCFRLMAELTMIEVKLSHDFVRHIPGFDRLSEHDQTILQRESKSGLFLLRLAKKFDRIEEKIVFGNKKFRFTFRFSEFADMGICAAPQSAEAIARALSTLTSDDNEFALLAAIDVFSHRDGLRDLEQVEDLYEVYSSSLQSYCEWKRPRGKEHYASLVGRLESLRRIATFQMDDAEVELMVEELNENSADADAYFYSYPLPASKS